MNEKMITTDLEAWDNWLKANPNIALLTEQALVFSTTNIPDMKTWVWDGRWFNTAVCDTPTPQLIDIGRNVPNCHTSTKTSKVATCDKTTVENLCCRFINRKLKRHE